MAAGNANPFLGWASGLLISEETTYGTFVTGTSFIEFNTESLKNNRDEIPIDAINSQRGRTKRLTGGYTVEGPLEFPFNVAEDGNVILLKQAMGGTVSSATITAGAYNHTIYAGDMENNAATATASDVKSLSVSVRRGASSSSLNVFNFYGGRVNNITIKGEIGAPVVVSADMIFQGSSTTATSPAASFANILPLNFSGIEIQTGDSIGNVSTEYFTGFELAISNNLNGDQRSLGSRNITVLPPQNRDVTLKLMQRFDTLTSYDRFIQNTLTAIKIICDAEQTITAGGSTYSMVIDVPEAYYNSNSPEVGGPDVLTHEVDLSALFNQSEGKDLSINIRNATANYE